MERTTEKAGVDSSISLLKLVSVLIIFAVGVVVGLVSSSNINRPAFVHFDISRNNDGQRMMDSFVGLRKNLNHGLSDDELFWKASFVPQKVDKLPFRRLPRVAFMFLTRGPLPMLPLWERFFSGQDVDNYSIYVHAMPGFELQVDSASVFYRRQVVSQHVEWASMSLVDAEKRLLANALLDFSNERFVLLSESCIPIYDFPTVHKYLTDSVNSFVESYDEPGDDGRGRYADEMGPDIKLGEWRKGSQWFEMHRGLAVKIVSDTKYYSLFKYYSRPLTFPDEHYIPTYIQKFHGALNANRTVTYVDWSILGPHPATFTADNITKGFIESLRRNGALCQYNSGDTPICYLFARKFDPSALEPLLNLTSQVMGY